MLDSRFRATTDGHCFLTVLHDGKLNFTGVGGGRTSTKNTYLASTAVAVLRTSSTSLSQQGTSAYVSGCDSRPRTDSPNEYRRGWAVAVCRYALCWTLGNETFGERCNFDAFLTTYSSILVCASIPPAVSMLQDLQSHTSAELLGGEIVVDAPILYPC